VSLRLIVDHKRNLVRDGTSQRGKSDLTNLVIITYSDILPFEAPKRERASFLLEGSQATPARPSGRNNVKVKTLW
jgi:hypothetical protein